MDREVWQATVHGITKSQMWQATQHAHTYSPLRQREVADAETESGRGETVQVPTTDWN